MAKKAAKTRKAPVKPAATRPEAGGPKPAVQAKMMASEILETRNGEFLKVLEEAAAIVRAASFTEVQIDLQKALAGTLENQRKTLVTELVAVKKTNAEYKSKVDSLTSETNKVKSENQNLQKKVDSLTKESDKLSDAQSGLKKDVASLEKRANALEEDVKRLQAIRKEYMERISKFREMREDLIR